MFKKLKAFTMAEAILVMTILGIIATIMISTLKPAEYKDKALKIMAKKVMSEIDVATTQIIMNDSIDGTFTNLKKADGSGNLSSDQITAAIEVAALYKKYLTSIRKTPVVKYWDVDEMMAMGDSAFIFSDGRQDASFVLKDGASLAVYGIPVPDSHEGPTIFPGETDVVHSYIDTPGFYMVYDTNDGEGPNVWGKDRFAFFIGPAGIVYDIKEGNPTDTCFACAMECQDNPSSCGCSTNDTSCFIAYCSGTTNYKCEIHI